ncbi:MAG: ATP-binding protein [Paludibacter sp.]|nr:ATP-binding protein [Paludibacter sp.]
MIISFSVQNFGSIKDKQTLSFEAEKSNHLEDAYVIKVGSLRLLKLALIYGANASGKTTLLKALTFLRDLVLHPRSTKSETLNFEPYLFDSLTPTQSTVVSIAFIHNGIRYAYEVEFVKSAIIREELYFFNPNRAVLYKRVTNLETQYAELTLGSKVKVDKVVVNTLSANTLWNNTVLGAFLKINVDFPELKEVLGWFDTYLQPIVYTHSDLSTFVSKRIMKGDIVKADILKVLQKADFHITDLAVSEEVQELPDMIYELLKKDAESKGQPVAELTKQVAALKLELEHSVNSSVYKLPFNLESNGTQRFYGFAGLLTMLLRVPAVLPVDELETSLHPDLVRHFLLSFIMNSKNSQLITTTHYRELLNDRDFFRNDVVWFATMNENCATEIYSLSDFGSDVVRDTTNVLNAYKTGKLGGIPNPGDYYIEFE